MADFSLSRGGINQSGRGFHHQMLKLLEHQRPHIPDWRMCKGEWEIWANGFHEEGAVHNMAMVHNLYCYVENTMQVRGGCVAR